MAHPKRKTSKQRKRKRRTHCKAKNPTLAVCPTTGVTHQYHRAYEVEGELYYRGKLVIAREDMN